MSVSHTGISRERNHEDRMQLSTIICDRSCSKPRPGMRLPSAWKTWKRLAIRSSSAGISLLGRLRALHFLLGGRRLLGLRLHLELREHLACRSDVRHQFGMHRHRGADLPLIGVNVSHVVHAKLIGGIRCAGIKVLNLRPNVLPLLVPAFGSD